MILTVFISLRLLGDLIIDLMGWDGSHLNRFAKGDTFYVPYYQRDDINELPLMFGPRECNQEDYSIADLLTKKTQTVTFEYDFGDGWEHDVRLSSVAEYQEGEERKIVFVGGGRACPVEDCGGVMRYQYLLQILDKHKEGKCLNAEEKQMLEWAGLDKNYDPEHLDKVLCESIVEDYNATTLD